MAPESYTDPRLTITGTEVSASNDSTTYIIQYKSPPPIKKESKEEKRIRLALEKNRASWVVFNEKKPTIKHIIKPIINYNRRRV